MINPASIQADNGAGLTRGIIGLVNKGQPRKPDDWGSLRSWAWGAAESKYGPGNAGQLPVDSHSLIAMCAPRLTFISYGIPEQGDVNWLDQKGSYMATVAAGAVFKLLGVKDIGVSNDCRTEVMPPHNTSMLDGELAWRQHDGGHTDAPNMKYFIEWANKKINYKPVTQERR